MTFLFATQMPDMKKKEYPEVQQINILNEGTVIKDVPTKPVRLGLWVGQVQQHKYTFIEVENEEGEYQFRPHFTFAATKVELLGKEAINCISNKKKDDNGKEVSAMQPEAAAGWLGAMAHYYGDLINPAHIHGLYLAQEPEKRLYVEDKYHKWIENHLAALTMWDCGPETSVFKFDFSLIDNQIITPIPPRIAATELAEKTIKTAFRIDGNSQYKYGEPFSGMYIDDADQFWKWEDDISFVGRDRSQHKAFYTKVERLLCWAVYYTACAMQYCYDEGKKKNNNDDPNHNYYVDNPPREVPPSDRPIPDANNQRDALNSQSPTNRKLERIARNFRNLGENLATWALLGIARIFEEAVKVISK